MCRQQVIFKTLIPEIDVIVTNQLGDIYLNGQFVVAEIDTEAHECPQCYGLMPFDEAMKRAERAVDEIRIVATAVIPDDIGF